MTLHFNCSCGKLLRADPALAGRHTRCPTCGMVLTIPISPLAGPEAGDWADESSNQRSPHAPLPDPDSPSEESYLPEDPSPRQRDSGLSVPALTRSESRSSAWHATPSRPEGGSRPRVERSAAASSRTSAREFLYLILALALVPLGFSLLAKEDVSVNGVSPGGIYVVRFVSCVALHALWCGSVGITLWRRQETIQGDVDWSQYSVAVLRILSVPMVLHGLYDTLLKKDMNAYAFVVGVMSFAWFVWQVESARGGAAKGSSQSWAQA